MLRSFVKFQGNAALLFSSSGCTVQGVLPVSCSIIPRIYCNHQVHPLPSGRPDVYMLTWIYVRSNTPRRQLFYM